MFSARAKKVATPIAMRVLSMFKKIMTIDAPALTSSAVADNYDQTFEIVPGWKCECIQIVLCDRTAQRGMRCQG
jgi:hypothetical protein